MPHGRNHSGQNNHHNQWSNQQYSSQSQYPTYPNQQFMSYENGGNLTYPDEYSQPYAQQGHSSTTHMRYPANSQPVVQMQSRQSHTYQTQSYSQATMSQHPQPHSQTHHSNHSYEQPYRHPQPHSQPYATRPHPQVVPSYAPQPTVIIPPSNYAGQVALSPDSGSSQYDYPASPSRPFSCDLCALSFNRQHDLKRHRETHTGEKPYNCNGGCGKTFTRKDALKRHQIVKGCGRVDDSWS